MLLAQGRFWRASMTKSSGCVSLEVLKGSLPEDLDELRDLKFEVPLPKWNLLVKNVHAGRKLLGGLLLDFATHKDRVSAAVGSDRLLAELQRVVIDATAALVEAEALVLASMDAGGE
jgi:hypothetical protein